MSERTLESARNLRARTLRLDDQIRDAVEAATALIADAREHPGHGIFPDEIGKVEKGLDAFLGVAPAAGAWLERMEREAEGEPPTLTSLILSGEGEAAQPSTRALATLLVLVEGESVAAGGEQADARPALLFLLRLHPPSVEALRELSNRAPSTVAEDLLWQAQSEG